MEERIQIVRIAKPRLPIRRSAEVGTDGPVRKQSLIIGVHGEGDTCWSLGSSDVEIPATYLERWFLYLMRRDTTMIISITCRCMRDAPYLTAGFLRVSTLMPSFRILNQNNLLPIRTPWPSMFATNNFSSSLFRIKYHAKQMQEIVTNRSKDKLPPTQQRLKKTVRKHKVKIDFVLTAHPTGMTYLHALMDASTLQRQAENVHMKGWCRWYQMMRSTRRVRCPKTSKAFGVLARPIKSSLVVLQ